MVDKENKKGQNRGHEIPLCQDRKSRRENSETDGAPFMSHVELKTKIFHRFCMRVKNSKVFLPFHD